MEIRWVLLCRAVALSLPGADMNDHCFLHLGGTLKRCYHLLDIMSVDRSDIGQSHILKKHSRNQHTLHQIFKATDPACQLITEMRKL